LIGNDSKGKNFGTNGIRTLTERAAKVPQAITKTDVDFFTVPTAPDPLAQGNALGINEKYNAALKGRNTERHRAHEGTGYSHYDSY
jgi:hypothetical protein